MPVLRWQEWDGIGIQHVTVNPDADGGFRAEGMVVGSDPFACSFRLAIDRNWLVRRVEVAVVAGETVVLDHDGAGNWTRDGNPERELSGAWEPDISVTPLTNIFPVRRLGLTKGQKAEIRTAYIDVPTLAVFADPQRYTCLEEGSLYLYESLDSDFRAEVSLGADGFVTTYPNLFRRVR